MALLPVSNIEPLYVADHHCPFPQPASHPLASPQSVHSNASIPHGFRRPTRCGSPFPYPMRWSWNGLPTCPHRRRFHSLSRNPTCFPPLFSLPGGNGAGRNSGRGGGRGGNGGGHGDFSSGSEDYVHDSCYGIAIMMGLHALCHDVHEEKGLEQKTVLDCVKTVVSNALFVLFSPQAHAKTSNRNARSLIGNTEDTNIHHTEQEIERKIKENVEPDIDNVNCSDESVDNDINTSIRLEKLENGKHLALGQQELESMHSATVSPMAIITWFSQPALAKAAGDQEELAKIQKGGVVNNHGEPKMNVVHSSEQEAGGDFGVAKKSDIEILRRLQREVFSELMKIRERLDKIEQLVQTHRRADQLAATRTHLKGETKAAMAFVLLEDSSSWQSRDALARAEMHSGLNACFTFESQFRGKDALVTQFVSGQGCSVGDSGAIGGPLTLGKLKYVKYINDDISVSFVPLGAQGKDVTEIINVFQDQGLTSFSSQGPALFKHCRGSAVGVTVSGPRFAFSLAEHLSGWGNVTATATTSSGARNGGEPLCLSTLAQFLFQPIEGIIISFSGLRQYWPSPPLPSSLGLHWSEMGPLVIPRFRSSKKKQFSIPPTDSFDQSPSLNMGFPDLEYGAESLECKGTALLSFALGSSVELSESVNISAWAQIEKGDSLQESDKGNLQWAINIMKSAGHGIDWGASVGSCRSDFWSMSANDNEGYLSCGDRDSYSPQLQMEAFLRIDCGRGFILQPGFLYVSNKSTHIPAFIIQSKWSL